MLTPRTDPDTRLLAAIDDLAHIYPVARAVVERGSFPPSSFGRCRAMKMNYCFYNAFTLAGKMGGAYWEGFATVPALPGIPLEHAWVVKDGQLFDPTWTPRRGHGDSYIGIEISPDQIALAHRHTGVYGVLPYLVRSWRSDNPLTEN